MDGASLSLLVLVLVITMIVVVVVAGILFVIAKFYRKVDQGKALIINKMTADPEVTFTGGVVYPIIHRAEVMDISVKSILIARSGKDGLICADNIRADIKVAFFVRVNKTTDDVLRVAQSIGCERASAMETLEELFAAKFSEALKTVGKQLEFEQLYTQREDFKDRIIEVIGRDLNGYALEDVAIDYLEQTPIESLDKDNILDARGIRKITEITAQQNLHTNQLRQDERKGITRQNLEADEAILELERRRADAEAKQQREIATMKAREDAETAKIQAEERQRSELARIKADEEIAVSELNKQRQVEVAGKDKERVVAIKSEQVERDRDLEIIARRREVERQEIDKEMELEVKRKEIAEVVRTRIVVDKNVAEEEERIKDLRATAEATRHKDVQVIGAHADAEESLVKEIKAAEAMEKVAEFKAREVLTLANAELESSERSAKARIRIAESVQAEQAARGLADAKVKEAQAIALEKEGLAEARVTEEKGMVAQRVREQSVSVLEREGQVEAGVLLARMNAEAQGTEVTGTATAKALEEHMRAEANGLKEKLVAMQAMEGAAREHEEFRLNLEHNERVRLAAMEMNREVAEAQSRVLGEAFGKADIKIVGGDGQFLDRFVQAASLGHAMDGFLANSHAASGLLADGGGPLVDGLKGVVDALRPTVDATASLRAALARASDPEERSRLQRALDALLG